ncbi:phage portal protein [Clostridium pasteurianum]|uniref:Phage-related protein n=1 Tax=Clostridium pasteurianum BC1 TaxID=86416 RepID=R4KAY1_CLOPA|nr:phage portal protein [Clostridium pasteurianum]AGK96795.1 phage-related protein [Clostridium pasteurianum BC1]
MYRPRTKSGNTQIHSNSMQGKQKKYNGYASQQINIPPNLTTGDFLRTYGDGSNWLYACVSKISQNIADVDWSAYSGDKELTEKQSQALAVLNHPNPYISRYELMELTDMWMSLCGKSFWVIEKDKAGRNREIWPVSPLDMWIVPDRNDYIKGYIYKSGADQIPFTPDQVIFFNNPDPYNQYGGIGQAQGCRNSLEIDKYSNEHNRNFFYNGAKLSGILNVEQDLDDESFDRLTEQFRDNHMSVDRAHSIAMIEGSKASFTDLTMNNKDMDFYNLRQLTRDEILGVFGVNKSILGLDQTSSLANMETAEYSFQKHVIRPRLRRIQDKLNNEYVQLFGEDDVQLQFTDPVPANKEFLVATIGQLTNKMITVNEGRKILNKLLDDVELDLLSDGDVIYNPMNLVPMGTPPVTQQTVPTSDATDNNDTTEELPQKSIRKTNKSTKAKLKQLIQKSNITRIQERDKMSKPLENEFQDTMTKYFKVMKDDVIKKFNDGSRNPVDLVVWDKTLTQIVTPLYAKIFKTSGNAVVNEFKGYSNILRKDAGNTDNVNIVFDYKDPNVTRAIKNKVMKIKGVNQTTKDNVAELIKDMYESEEDNFTIKDISDAISNMPEFDEARAETIAQTEVMSSINQATISTYQQNSNLIDGKSWLAVGDSHTRDSHIQASMDYDESNSIAVDDYFNLNGNDCLCPGDGELPPEESINCRCCMMPVVKVDETE